jgi:hypothetical protein
MNISIAFLSIALSVDDFLHCLKKDKIKTCMGYREGIKNTGVSPF